jgi:predicted Rossmann fold flavoprotein
MVYDIVIIGGGAAGFFSAIQACELAKKKLKILILESSPQCLQKVKVSGGGRCNVTHHFSGVQRFVESYPRGEKFLLTLFNRWSPEDTVNWFERHQVPLKTEADGRVFPTSNQSQSIINCFYQLIDKYQIEVLIKQQVISIKKEGEHFHIKTKQEKSFSAQSLVVATGGLRNKNFQSVLENLNHQIILPLPSLFSFHIQSDLLQGLAGISFQEVEVKLQSSKFFVSAPLLITHRGLSGPAILKLSAFQAIELHKKNYQCDLMVNWVPAQENILLALKAYKQNNSKKLVSNQSPFTELPRRFWQKIIEHILGINGQWANVSQENLKKIFDILTQSQLTMNGKTLNKDEFVTCGGIDLKQINPKNLESKEIPNLYFCGEVLNIDGITGGFNFQSAWSSAYCVACSLVNG